LKFCIWRKLNYLIQTKNLKWKKFELIYPNKTFKNKKKIKSKTIQILKILNSLKFWNSNPNTRLSFCLTRLNRWSNSQRNQQRWDLFEVWIAMIMTRIARLMFDSLLYFMGKLWLNNLIYLTLNRDTERRDIHRNNVLLISVYSKTMLTYHYLLRHLGVGISQARPDFKRPEPSLR